MNDPEYPVEYQEEPKKRNGIWAKLGGGALTFAVVFHLVILIIGAIWIFQRIYEPEKKIDFLPGGGSAGGGERSAQTKVQQKKRAQITPTTNVKRVFAEGAASNFSIPDPGDNFGEMSTLSSLAGGGMSGGLGGSGSGGGFGSGHGTGTGLGAGGGVGKLFGLIPETMRKRCSKEDRLQRLRDNGGTPACEDAVVKGLRWLKNNQKADGSFADGNRKVSMTGLALLAYFGHCETPMSEEFGESCMKAIVFLVEFGMKNDCKLSGTFTDNGYVYEHAIATYALGEAYTFCKDLKIDVPNLPEVTERAGQFIIDNQHDSGGWAYLYNTEAGHVDVSVTGWQVQALKACSHTPIKYKGMTGAINKALRYIDTCQADSGGYGYTGPRPAGEVDYFTLTGVGLLCNQMWGKSGAASVRKGVKYVTDNTKFEFNGEFCDLYGHYYESQAMMQAGGEAWKHYNDLFRDQVLSNQNEDGSWKAPGANAKSIRAVGPEFRSNPVYRTCLCTLMLEVYYRFLSTGGGGGIRQRPGI